MLGFSRAGIAKSPSTINFLPGSFSCLSFEWNLQTHGAFSHHAGQQRKFILQGENGESWNCSSTMWKGSGQVMVATKEADSGAGVAHTSCLMSTPLSLLFTGICSSREASSNSNRGPLTEDTGQFFTGGGFVSIRGDDLISALRKVSMMLFFEGRGPPNNTTLLREQAFSVYPRLFETIRP